MRIAALVLAGLALAGCSAPPSGAAPRHVEMAVPMTDSYPGLLVSGVVDGDGADFVAEVRAENGSGRTYRVEDGCTTPWDDVVLKGDPVQHRQPIAHCAAFHLADFPPNSRLARTFTWNATLWDESAGRYHAAPPGAYVWSIRFVAYAPDGAALKRFDLDFPVAVR